MSLRSWHIDSEEAMLEFGRQFAAALPVKALVLLSGNLGAGKTTLTKGIAEGLGAASADEVSSPTFTLIHEYGNPVRLYHIDLYRLEEERQLATLGLEEILDREAVTVIEWPERFLRWLPPDHYLLQLDYQGDQRVITLTPPPDAPEMPAILASAFPMDSLTECGELQDTFALVAYINGPLGAFLNDLRRRLDPGSEPNAHVTLLPPRQLQGTPEQAQTQIRELIAGIHTFHLELAAIEIFPSTHVVFVEPGLGKTYLLDIHAALNVGALFYNEPYAYHPHVTLVQFQPPETVGEKTMDALASWKAYAGPRQITVSRLTFVKHAGGNRWLDIESYDLLD